MLAKFHQLELTVICLGENKEHSLEAMKNYIKCQIKCLITQILVSVHFSGSLKGLFRMKKYWTEFKPKPNTLFLEWCLQGHGFHQEFSRAQQFQGFLYCQKSSTPFWCAASKALHMFHRNQVSILTHSKISIPNKAQKALPPAIKGIGSICSTTACSQKAPTGQGFTWLLRITSQ